MADVKRYSYVTHREASLNGVWERDDGEFVTHEDYTALAAEVSRLRASLAGLLAMFPQEGEDVLYQFERIAADFERDTGFMRPGKSQPLDCGHTDAEREDAWKAWVAEKLLRARAALAGEQNTQEKP
jgi:hypothetical protein